MDILPLEQRRPIDQNQKLTKAYTNLQNLLEALRDRSIPDEVIARINEEVQVLNASRETDKKMIKKLHGAKNSILKLIEKELKLVPKNYYRNLWMAVGMTAFGLPIGVAISTALGNMAFLAIGLPIGLPIGMAVGSAMDKKALDEGRQLDVVFEA